MYIVSIRPRNCLIKPSVSGCKQVLLHGWCSMQTISTSESTTVTYCQSCTCRQTIILHSCGCHYQIKNNNNMQLHACMEYVQQEIESSYIGPGLNSNPDYMHGSWDFWVFKNPFASHWIMCLQNVSLFCKIRSLTCMHACMLVAAASAVIFFCSLKF